MRFKLLIAGAAVAGLLLLGQALGVFGAGLRGERSQAGAASVSAATSAAAAKSGAALRIAAVGATPVMPVEPPLIVSPSVTATPSPVGAIRRTVVLPTPTALPAGSAPRLLNDLPSDMIAVAPEDVQQNVRQIYVRGQALGRNPHAFSKVGDSTMLWPLFLVNFDWRQYRLGEFAHLQRTIDRFPGSFSRESLAVRKGMHTWGQFDPAQADQAQCLPTEGPLACELRVNNPSFALIRLGANDSLDPAQFEPAMRRLLDTCIASGVVPILGTKPDHYEGSENTINRMIRRLATEYRVPLWDFDLAAETVPGRGLQPDGLHLIEGGTDDFGNSDSFQHIGPVEDLSALMTLDAASQAALGANK